MGNHSSGHINVQQPPPPPWTQSLPRDVHKHRKYGALEGRTKVLPERIPGQRLRPTENGRNLQIQGTISPRKSTEVAPQTTNLSQSQSSTPVYPPNCNGLRFGSPPTKSFTSEPDLRENSPTTERNLVSSPLTNDNPSKSKIKSKKRCKAPLPPPLRPSNSFPIDTRTPSNSFPIDTRTPSNSFPVDTRTRCIVPSPSPFENMSSASSPGAKLFLSKPKKIGLFKKRNESRMSKYDIEHMFPPRNSQTPEIVRGGQRMGLSPGRSRPPLPFKISSKKELKEKARSLDNLQHEMKRIPKELTSSLHSLEIIGSIPPEKGRLWYEGEHHNQNSDSSESRRCSTIERDSHSRPKDSQGLRLTSCTLDRESKSHRRMSNVERRLYEKQLQERGLEERLSYPTKDNKRIENGPTRVTSDYRRSSSSCSSYRDYLSGEPKDAWDKAEEDWYQKKKRSEKLKMEILIKAQNLRKTNLAQENLICEVDNNKEVGPKTFFFGMEPKEPDSTKISGNANTAFVKLNEQNDGKTPGMRGQYSSSKETNEADTRNRSLDYRDRTRSKSWDKEMRNNAIEDKKKPSRKTEEFSASLEKPEQQRVHSPEEELSNSISRKGDGGYHSRQNSGSFHLDTEGSDEDNLIRMNIRPTLPRKQLELPRFSPNAAWRSLSVEPSIRQNYSDSFGISEDKIYRYTRPTAPPRGNGEKSADSGISGDVGNPAPINEFEPLTPEKLKSSSGPLAVSSPLASARLEVKRAWTPAQDLDENSFEDNGEQSKKSPLERTVAALPKLTSRSNMFMKSKDLPGAEDANTFDCKNMENNSCIGKYHATKTEKHERKFRSQINQDTVLVNNFQRMKRSLSSPRGYEEIEKEITNDHNWRENWTMSRSIPNSLDNCDEADGVIAADMPNRSRSESRVSGNNLDDNGHPGSRPITPSYLQRGTNGHIMYLPEYKSYSVDGHESVERKFIKEGNVNGNVEYTYGQSSLTPELHPKSYSGNVEDAQLWMNNSGASGQSRMVVNGKRSKKFAYKSTVRILEKKKLEEKLSKEVEEKERRRLQEIEAMLKVEEEFQKKREREKRRLKKQLKIYQQEELKNQNYDNNLSSSSEDKGFSSQCCGTSPAEERPQRTGDSFSNGALQACNGHHPAVPFLNGSQMVAGPYRSLPVDLSENSYHSFGNSRSSCGNQNGLFSGLKKWVKGKKESRSGYLSDTSSTTVASHPRQEPDGAPASSRRNGEIRAEIIAASRHRNGTPVLLDQSPVASTLSKESQRRPYSVDSKRTTSPDSRKSLSSESCPLTQELPEMRQEQRQYREYRSSTKLLMPVRSNQRVSNLTHNYRRDFCLGSGQMKYSNDDSDRYSRRSNSSNSRQSCDCSSTRRSSSDTNDPDRDLVTNDYSSPKCPVTLTPNLAGPYLPVPPIPLIDKGVLRVGSRLTNGLPPPPIDSSPARFAQGLITPFNPKKGGYRPVSFSPPPPGKILTVT